MIGRICLAIASTLALVGWATSVESVLSTTATGDGRHDDGPALEQTLAHCNATSPPLYLAAGQYLTSRTLTFSTGCRGFAEPSLSYEWDVAPRVKIFATFTDKPVLVLNSHSSLKGIGVAGGQDAVVIAGAWVDLDRVNVRQAARYGINCSTVNGNVQGLQINRSLIGYNGGDGVYFGYGCWDSWIGNHSYVNANGGNGVNNTVCCNSINDDRIEWNGLAGVVSGVQDNSINGNQIRDNGQEGLVLGPAYKLGYHSISGNNFRNNGRLPTPSHDCHVNISANLDSAAFAGNTYMAGTDGPNYVFCATTAVLTNSSIADALTPQMLGIYANAATQAAIKPALVVYQQ